ncbi:MAG: 4Fe-4S dicluster domain-containing protein [Chloroflexi bacterium]|nr:4Fe-4S dicluster domain-containing protein [Chloroflexota bacterium]
MREEKIHQYRAEWSEAEQGKWGLVVDQDLCTGCQACVTACAMENNIPFVGEEDTAYGRAMHWIRLERFWEGEYPEVKATPFQAVMCQQCGSAPCEPVCPVFASVHSQNEKLNVQVYNRCVGTRYCANNCPYVARTFNWRDYDRPEPLNNQLNPDVTVRRRGIMEKCTFCVQRIRMTEDQARADGREVYDGEIEPACVQACPGEALVFGRIDDPQSAVSKRMKNGRAVKLLEELGAQPRVTYLKGGA